MKRILSILLAALLCISFCACGAMENALEAIDVPATPKTFTVENLTIDLNDDFFRMDAIAPEYDFCIGSEHISILGLRVDFAEYELDGIDLWEYAEAYHSVTEQSTLTELKDLNGIPTMQYEASDDDDSAKTVFIAFYEASDCFWVLNFAFDADEYSTLYPLAEQYALSVKCS